VGAADGFDQLKADSWLNWMERHQLSWANWNITDKDETTALLYPSPLKGDRRKAI